MTKPSNMLRLTVASMVLCAGLLPLRLVAGSAAHRLSKDDVVKLLKGQVSPHRVGQRAREQGIDFELTSETERELRRAGATDELIATLRQLAPAPQPAQIVIETSPDAEVYLDDTFKGQASRQGRLVIDNPKPGPHTLRLTLLGKQDFEQKVTVETGQVAMVKTVLAELAGRIRVTTALEAEVFLDDSSRGTTGVTGQLVVSNVAPGSHELHVSAPGMREWRQSITVLAGQESTVEAPLERIGPPPAGTVRENPKDGLKYVWIPPGTFVMGCSPGDSECDGDEKPAHQVTITKGFWLGQTDVTVGAYKRFAGSSGRKMPPSPNFNNGWANDNMPMVNVSWDDAQGYCAWVGGRLPTETEWEYAARAGSTKARYDNLDEAAWYSQNSSGQTHGVAQKQANGFALFDMSGNVWQWVADWYDEHYFQTSPPQDPQGPASGRLRVLRGGSWNGAPRSVRVSFRAERNPNSRANDNGFRCGGEAGNP